MLQLQTKSIDICRISKLLVKYNVKASIVNQVITLEGELSDELLTQLCGSININSVQNFISKESLHVSKKRTLLKGEKTIQSKIENNPVNKENFQTDPILKSEVKLDLIYPKVKRGEAYWCDLGIPDGSEQGGYRPVIVVSKDEMNMNDKWDNIIVVPCTTTIKEYTDRFSFRFSDEVIKGKSSQKVCTKLTDVITGCMTVIDKSRLREYIGTMNPKFMEKMQIVIDDVLHLSREVKTVVKQEKVYVDRPVPKKTMVDPDIPKERKDVNMVQVQLLSFVDINELLKISQSYSTDEVKAKRILELFGFDFKKNGVQYLLKAIIISPQDDYFNLETLSESVSQTEGIDKEEIKRLIVARVKEQFKLKKAPTIDFIRLINNFLTKQEENYENNI